MSLIRWTTAVAVATVALAACQKAETPEQTASRMQAETDSARTAIAAQNARFVRYVNANQADSLALLYPADGVILQPDMPAATGRDSIKARYAALFAPGGVMTLTTVALTANGPVAIERGTWTYMIPAQGKTPAMHLAGKSLVHWHKVNGQWMFAEDMWNNDAPAPAAPAPAARH
jgi:ketosteroid isomerase-like protein